MTHKSSKKVSMYM